MQEIVVIELEIGRCRESRCRYIQHITPAETEDRGIRATHMINSGREPEVVVHPILGCHMSRHQTGAPVAFERRKAMGGRCGIVRIESHIGQNAKSRFDGPSARRAENKRRGNRCINTVVAIRCSHKAGTHRQMRLILGQFYRVARRALFLLQRGLRPYEWKTAQEQHRDGQYFFHFIVLLL